MTIKGSYHSIKYVSEIFKSTPNKLRFYESKGLLSPSRNPVNGYREYSEKDLIDIRMILTYRALDISLVDIQKMMDKSLNLTLEDQLVKQLQLIKTRMSKYQIIQDGFESIMNNYLVDMSTAKLSKEFIKLGDRIQYDNHEQINWKDLWNFDEFSETYDDFIHDSLRRPAFYNNYQTLIETVFNQACKSLEKEDHVLEIGVGTGNLAGLFLKDNRHIIGLDQSVRMMKKAREKYPNLKLKYGEFLRLPFEDHTFKCIVSTYAFHHLRPNEKELALIEMLRLLRYDGEILIGDIVIRESTIPHLLNDSDEYYTDISWLKHLVSLYHLSFSETIIDSYTSVIRLWKEKR